MSWQSSLSSEARPSVRSTNAGSSLDLGLVAGVALMALGAALFGVAIFHGFENGSCSTTGYSAHYGPVQHCGKGVGWWSLLVLVGLLVLGAGAMLATSVNSLAIPVLFVALGAPFVALALRGGNVQLMQGTSASTGRIFAGLFGGAFVLAGVIWGAFAGRKAVSALGGSLLAAVVASVVGVGLAFAVAAGVSSAIGPPTTVRAQQVVSPAAAKQTSAAAAAASAAVSQATAAADKATKLAACVTAAGASPAKIQACEAKYTP